MDATPLVLATLQQQLTMPNVQSGLHDKVLRCLLSWIHYGVPIG